MPYPDDMAQMPTDGYQLPAQTPADGYQDAVDHPLRPVVDKWLKAIAKAKKHKKEQFGDDAAIGMRFFQGPYDFMYDREYREESKSFRIDGGGGDFDVPTPSFQISANVVSEMVEVFGPILYHKNPDRLAKPRKLPELPPGVLTPMGSMNSLMGGPDPMAAQMEMMLQQQLMQQQTQDETRSHFMEWVLNYTPTELGLKKHSRLAVDETIIKGMGVLVTQMYTPKGSNISLPGSFWMSVDYLQLDPDAENIMDIQWGAIEKIRPVWEVEDEWGHPRGSLKAHIESYDRQAETDADPDGEYHRRRGDTNDLICYYEVYSKMGIGGRLKGCPGELYDTLEQFGDYCYMVIAKGVPFPINLPPELINASPDQPVDQNGMPLPMPDPEAVAADPSMMGADPMMGQGMEPQRTVQDEILARLEWPTPFWLDDEWPWTPFVFHYVPGQLWPMSHLKPAIGYVQFLQWAYSFLASRVRISCRDFIAIKKAAGEELKSKILEGRDLTLLEIDEANPGTINEIVSFLNHPQVNGDMFRCIEMIKNEFERATGLTELFSGFSRHQFRSAEEAQLKGDSLHIRPDDMSDKIEEAMTDVARKEALCWRWHDTTETVRVLMGPAAAQVWQQLVQTKDPYEITHQLEYRIEAGSTRKPNRDKMAASMQDALQTLLPILWSYAQMTGQTGPVNSLIKDWATANGWDATTYLLPMPPPPPPPPPEKGGEKKKPEKPEGGKPDEGQPPPPDAGGPAPPPMPPPMMPPGMAGGMDPAAMMMGQMPANMPPQLAALLSGMAM